MKTTSRARPWLSSLCLHGLIAGIMALLLANENALVRGGAGLFGATRTRSSALVVSLDPIVVPPPKIPIARDGLAVAAKKPTELPDEVKSKPREIDTPLPTQAERPAQGNSNEGPAGAPGQGGTSTTPSDQIGNSDRSNAMGIWLAKVHREVQNHLRQPGFLERSKRTLLSAYVLKNGSVSEIVVLKSSGERRIDLLAIDAVKRAQPFEPFDRDLNVEIPVFFNSR